MKQKGIRHVRHFLIPLFFFILSIFVVSADPFLVLFWKKNKMSDD